MAVVLVTGGAGYIGSHACKALARAGHTPVTYDNLVYGHRWAVKWGPLEEGDLADRYRLDAVMLRWRPEAVMHFAAYAYVGESVADPGKYYRNNFVGTLTLLEAMRDAGIGRIVFSSSCATYGVPQQRLIDEDHPQNPINPYGASKLMVERMLNDFGAAHDLQSISLRYFNAAGADADGEIGESHDPETHLIPLVLAAAARRAGPITVYGDDYDTTDGTCIRDYVHVDDLASAHCLALNALDQFPPGMTAFNIGTGSGHSVREVIAAAERICGASVPTIVGPRRVGDPPELVASADRAQRVLGWQAAHSDLASILASARRWHDRSAAGALAAGNKHR